MSASGEEENFDMEAHLLHVKEVFEGIESQNQGVGYGIPYS